MATDGTGEPGDKIMMTGYLDQGGSGVGQIHTVTVYDIPFAQYDVYLYHSSSGGPNRTARYQANTIDIFTRNLDPANTFNGFTRAGYDTLAEAADTANPAGNYVRWEGLTGATLSIEAQGIPTSAGGNGGETVRSPIQGIQIVNTTPGLPIVENLDATLVDAETAAVNGDLISNGEGAAVAGLTFYYGPEDGGTDPLAWADSAAAGTLTAPGTFSADLADLLPETTYYFRAFASNGAGDAWALTSRSFTTLRLPELPVVENLEATNTALNSATANGNLLSNGLGADTTELTIYWGLVDGGDDPLAWANASPAGSLSAPGTFSADLTGLVQGTLYYCRAFAANSAGGVWAPSSQTFVTLNPPVEAISLNFVRGSTGQTALAPGEAAGFIKAGFWNNAPQATANGMTGFVLLNGSGEDSGATADWQSGGASWSVATAGTGSAADMKMMTGYLDQGGDGNGQVHSITVHNVPYPSYNVYLYHSSSNGANRTARYQANSIDLFTRNLDPADTFDGWVHDQHATLEASNSSASGGNYVVWEGLSGSTLTIEAQGISANEGGFPGSGETRRAPVQGIQIVPAPAIELRIAASGDDLVLSWDSEDGKLYNLLSETDLAAGNPGGWPVYDSHMDIPATPPVNTLMIPRPGDPRRFFAIAQFNAPPESVFSDDFEAGPGGWTTVSMTPPAPRSGSSGHPPMSVRPPPMAARTATAPTSPPITGSMPMRGSAPPPSTWPKPGPPP